MLHFYGIRYLDEDESKLFGPRHPVTGKQNIDCEIVVFTTEDQLYEWIQDERPNAPCSAGGGKRIQATQSLLRDHCQGMDLDEFHDYLDEIKYEMSFFDRGR